MKTVIQLIVDEGKIDHLGHMNYLEYIIFSEKGMIDWFRKAGALHEELAQKKLGMVFINLDVNYLNEARLGDSLKIITKPVKLGTKSFVIKQEIYNQDQVQTTELTKTFVMFDTATRKSIPVIDEIARHFTKIKNPSSC